MTDRVVYISMCIVGVDAQIAMDLKGHFVTLSLSQFGCHVVQKVSIELV